MKKILQRVILGAAIMVFVGSCGLLAKLLIYDPYIADKSAGEAHELYYSSDAGQNQLNDEGILRNFEELISVNKDIKGWIRIDNTNIDYPIVQSDEPSFYLSHDFKRSQSRYGSIFIDSLCKLGAESKNVILHGHHMRDGKMFAGLMKFSDLDFYKETPIITFDSISNRMKWKIISIFKTNTRPDQGEIFNYIRTSFINDEDFLNYIYNIKIRSLIDIPVDINEDDRIVTLSTCSYEFEDFRTVLVARKIRTGESESVNTANAIKSPNPLMPEVFYRRNGGTPPKYSNFSDAQKSGEINWYGR